MAKWLAKSTSITESFYLLRNKLINQDEIEVILDVRNKIEKKIKNFEPIFLESKFNKRFPQKTQKIFVGSMSEIYYWKDEWLEKVLEKVKLYPQHTFQFLTKFPRIYYKWAFPPENCWLGITVTGKENKNDMQRIYEFSDDNANLEYHNVKFISFEPLLNKISPEFMTDIDWVIIGAETGNRKGKIIPKREWIEDIVNYCKWNNIPVYLKDSLKNIYPEKIKMFPNYK